MKYVVISIPVYGARSHPELAPRINKQDKLSDWYKKEIQCNDFTYFVSFTDLPKIGINPKFAYHNPIGVYTYPLRLVFKRRILDVDFAYGRNYIHVIKIISKQILDSDNYYNADYECDVFKLKTLFEKNQHKFDKSVVNKTKNQLGRFVTFDLNVKSFDDVLKLVDNNYETLLFLNKIVSSKKNKHLNKKDYFTKIWILTMLLSVFFSKKNYVTTWNKLLQYLGYKVVLDNNTGTIHPNEPKQAIFLTKDSYKVVNIINNTQQIIKFINLLKSNKIHFVEEGDKITIFGNLEIDSHKIFSLPKTLEVKGKLKINNSIFLDAIDNLIVTDACEISNSDINRIPILDINTLFLANQKLQCVSKSKINTLCLGNSRINTIGDSTLGILLLDKSVVKSIRDTKIDKIQLQNGSKILEIPEELESIIVRVK